MIGLIAALATVALVTLLAGIPALSLPELRDALAGTGDERAALGVRHLRLPRLVLAVCGGAGLGLAGALAQDSLRNPLAGPELLGISSGAATVAAAVIVFEMPVPFTVLPFLTLAGGLLSAGVVLAVMTRLRCPPSSPVLVLAGAALSAAFGAAVTMIVTFGERQEVGAVLRFLTGSLAGSGWPSVRVALPWLAVGIPAALMLARPLNLLRTGDDLAEGAGLAVVPARAAALGLCAVLTAALVAVAGAIGFVALSAPHIARRLLGTTDARRVLPMAAVVGALLLAGADLAARLAFSPVEVSVGLWTGIVGGPVLLAVLRAQLRGSGE
ncbi:MAG TPA: iron ABC transporter permease [Acidimicrobiales bacterium]|jgi:iron complex transport system permease protein|nr:iron ABC transporter permease [Acidimicrobiales bacterium]